MSTQKTVKEITDNNNNNNTVGIHVDGGTNLMPNEWLVEFSYNIQQSPENKNIITEAYNRHRMIYHPETEGVKEKSRGPKHEFFPERIMIDMPMYKGMLDKEVDVEFTRTEDIITSDGETSKKQVTYKEKRRIYFPGHQMVGTDIRYFHKVNKLCTEECWLLIPCDLDIKSINEDEESCLDDSIWCYAFWLPNNAFVSIPRDILDSNSITPRVDIRTIPTFNRKISAGRVVPVIPPAAYIKRILQSSEAKEFKKADLDIIIKYSKDDRKNITNNRKNKNILQESTSTTQPSLQIAEKQEEKGTGIEPKKHEPSINGTLDNLVEEKKFKTKIHFKPKAKKNRDPSYISTHNTKTTTTTMSVNAGVLTEDQQAKIQGEDQFSDDDDEEEDGSSTEDQTGKSEQPPNQQQQQQQVKSTEQENKSKTAPADDSNDEGSSSSSSDDDAPVTEPVKKQGTEERPKAQKGPAKSQVTWETL